MRLTGLATGLDMDEIVKSSMRPYRIKIEKKGQDKEILEIKQKLYREVIKDSREFYDKYFDVSKSDSLLLSKNWSTTKFTSSNENVLTVTGASDAKSGNYTITGTTGKPATAKIEKLDSEIVINGQTFKVEGSNDKEKASKLNKALSDAGINVSVRYTDFAGTESTGNSKGFIFESKSLGKDSTFTIGGTLTDVGTKVDGTNATTATIKGFKVSDFGINNSNKIELTIDGNTKSIEIDKDKIINSDGTGVDTEKLKKELNSVLKENKLSAEIDSNGDITFKSTVSGSDIVDPKITINGNSNGTFTDGKDATKTSNSVDLNLITSEKISVNGKVIDMSNAVQGKEVDYINEILSKNNIGVTASLNGNDIVFSSTKDGSNGKVDIKLVSDTNGDLVIPSKGVDAEIIIKDDKGGVYKHTGDSNTVTLDGITFKLNGEIPAQGIEVNGKKDITEVKDKIVNFINDYNKLIEKLNTLTTEKRNRGFNPLTADQKKEMSEEEIKLWNEKVKQGQLNRDNDLIRITNSLKQAMRTLVEGSDLNLEKIGINPSSDYQGVKNGTFTIDEAKLTKALEDNPEQVMNLFVQSKPSDNTLSDSSKYAKTGIVNRLKDILYNEAVSGSSAIVKKAGVEGTSSVFNNELSKSIEKYEQKMKDMEKDFARREQALYTKYANLETVMNKYNSQQSYLMQQLGLG